MRRHIFALTAASVGVGLLANPLYLDGLLVYPTASDGFAIGGQYHAALAGLGLVLTLGAVAVLVPDVEASTRCSSSVSQRFLFVGYEAAVDATMDPRETRILAYGTGRRSSSAWWRPRSHWVPRRRVTDRRRRLRSRVRVDRRFTCVTAGDGCRSKTRSEPHSSSYRSVYFSVT